MELPLPRGPAFPLDSPRMRKRGSRLAILPLLGSLFTPAALQAAAAPGAVTPAPAPPIVAAPAAPGASGTGVPAPASIQAIHGDLVPSLSHHLQFGLAVMPGDGYRVVIPYTRALTDCGDRSNLAAHVCADRAPMFIDLQPSFGISRAWDLLVDLRLGLERDYNTFRPFFVMPGFRYWMDPESHAKFFTTLQVAWDGTGQQPHTKQARSDFGLRNSNGLMLEVMRNLGVYFQFGETVGLVRWLSVTIDAGIGVQARMP